MASEGEEEGAGSFMETMFGGMVSLPLPVPEILNTLKRSKFKHK